MFHQVRVSEKHVDFLCFLWWPKGDTSQSPVEHRTRVYIFGAVASLSVASDLQRTATDNKDDFKVEVTDTIYNNFYVDDCLKSMPTEEDALSLVVDLGDICAKGGFQLIKWTSNSQKVLKHHDEASRGLSVDNFLAWKGGFRVQTLYKARTDLYVQYGWRQRQGILSGPYSSSSCFKSSVKVMTPHWVTRVGGSWFRRKKTEDYDSFFGWYNCSIIIIRGRCVGATSVYLSVLWVLSGLHRRQYSVFFIVTAVGNQGQHGVVDHAFFTACSPSSLTHLTTLFSSSITLFVYFVH